VAQAAADVPHYVTGETEQRHGDTARAHQSAARMKNGTAIRGKELIPLKKRWAR